MTSQSGMKSIAVSIVGEWISPPTQWQANSPQALLSSEELSVCMQRLPTGLPYLQGATLALKEQLRSVRRRTP